MKILMTTHYFASHRGGIEIVAEKLFEQWASMGHEAVWMASDATPPPNPVGASRTVCLRSANLIERKTGLPLPILTLGALRTIRREITHADIVVLHDCLYLSNIAAFLFARLRGVPIVVIQHIGLVPYKSGILDALMKFADAAVTRRMLGKAGQVVFISETTKNFFSGVSFRTPPDVIFNGVDTDVFRPPRGAERRAQLRQKFGLEGNCPVILFAGRFVEKKGLPALRRMAALRPDYTWAFAGWGPLDPSTWKAGNVRVLSGLQGSALADLYRASNLLVLPSTGEGFPLVVQEALASGLPVVCGAETTAADPAMQEFVRGVPVYPGDDERTASEFVAAIDAVINSGAETENQSESRHAFVVARYSWRHAAERYLQIASRMIMRRTTARAVSVVAVPEGMSSAQATEEQILDKVLR